MNVLLECACTKFKKEPESSVKISQRTELPHEHIVGDKMV